MFVEPFFYPFQKSPGLALAGHLVAVAIQLPVAVPLEEAADGGQPGPVEFDAVARAEGIDLPADVVERTTTETEGLADFKTSMLQDVEAGRPIEREPFYGFVAREGARLGVATPLAALVNDALGLLFEPEKPEAPAATPEDPA